MKVKVKLLSLSDSLRPVDCSPPGSSVHGILQARLLEWVAISFSRGSSWPRDWTQVSRIAGRRFNLWASGEWRYTNSYTAVLLLLFSCSVVSESLWPHGLQHARLPCPLTISRSLLKLTSGELVIASNYLMLCWPLLLPSIFPSIRVFSNELALRIRWPKYWDVSFGISPFSEYSALISFRIDWLDLLIVQVTLKSLLQHHSSEASILRWSAFFMVQLSHPYMTAGKTIVWLYRLLLAK